MSDKNIEFERIERNVFPETEEISVSENEYAEKTIFVGDKKVYIVHTSGRIGCDSSLLLTIEPNGTEHVVMTHYDPDHVSEHKGVIRVKTIEHPKGKRLAVLLTKGDETDDWRKRMVVSLKGYTNGNEPDLVSLPHLGVEHVKELANPENRLNYQLCFIRGYGGNLRQLRISVPKGNYEKNFMDIDLK